MPIVGFYYWKMGGRFPSGTALYLCFAPTEPLAGFVRSR